MRLPSKHARDVVDAGHGILVERNDDVAGRDATACAGLPACTSTTRTPDSCVRPVLTLSRCGNATWSPAMPSRARRHATVLQHLGQHVLGRVGGDREADALRPHDHGGVDADHLGTRV